MTLAKGKDSKESRESEKQKLREASGQVRDVRSREAGRKEKKRRMCGGGGGNGDISRGVTKRGARRSVSNFHKQRVETGSRSLCIHGTTQNTSLS